MKTATTLLGILNSGGRLHDSGVRFGAGLPAMVLVQIPSLAPVGSHGVVLQGYDPGICFSIVVAGIGILEHAFQESDVWGHALNRSLANAAVPVQRTGGWW